VSTAKSEINRSQPWVFNRKVRKLISVYDKIGNYLRLKISPLFSDFQKIDRLEMPTDVKDRVQAKEVFLCLYPI